MTFKILPIVTFTPTPLLSRRLQNDDIFSVTARCMAPGYEIVVSTATGHLHDYLKHCNLEPTPV